MTLETFFAQHPEAAIAFSGGVDSAYLLYAASRFGRRVKAYYVKSEFQPAFELADALRLAKELGADLEVIPLAALESRQIAGNPADRCYFCKRRIFTAILEAARKDGFSLLLDGTNASDEEADRPGIRALRELEVLSPLRLCGLDKQTIRQLSRQAGLFTWDKPAYACLATRIPTGTPITRQALEQTEKAEAFLFRLGFRDFRVRLEGTAARLQVNQGDLPRLLAHREEILTHLKPDYSAVWLDLEVRNGI